MSSETIEYTQLSGTCPNCDEIIRWAALPSSFCFDGFCGCEGRTWARVGDVKWFERGYKTAGKAGEEELEARAEQAISKLCCVEVEHQSAMTRELVRHSWRMWAIGLSGGVGIGFIICWAF